MDEKLGNGVEALPKEKVKELYFGSDGTRAEVTEEEQSTRSLSSKHSLDLMAQAGCIHQPHGVKYLGGAAIFYYGNETAQDNKKYSVVCQTDVGSVLEGHADFGHKQLKSALMKAYGRKEPKVRG